jgi:hypothetical protein
MDQPWEADAAAVPVRRLGRSPAELGISDGRDDCPDVWELSNGDIAVIGHDLTQAYAASLPPGLVIGEHERLVVIPRVTLLSAREGLPDA